MIQFRPSFQHSSPPRLHHSNSVRSDSVQPSPTKSNQIQPSPPPVKKRPALRKCFRRRRVKFLAFFDHSQGRPAKSDYIRPNPTDFFSAPSRGRGFDLALGISSKPAYSEPMALVRILI